MKPTCIAISGSDPSCGAGAQLDIRVMELFCVRPLSVITGITVQNGDSVLDVSNIPSDYVKKQLTCIAPLHQPSACKVGMLTTEAANIIEIILETDDILKIPIVLDPILKSSSGYSFLEKEKYYTLFKHCALVTPNIPEMESFTGLKINTYSAIEKSLTEFSEKFSCSNVLLKCGHLKEYAGSDFLLLNGNMIEILEDSHNVIEDIHGTGCFLSTAIASCLANQLNLEASIRLAKRKLVEYAEKSILPRDATKRIFSF